MMNMLCFDNVFQKQTGMQKETASNSAFRQFCIHQSNLYNGSGRFNSIGMLFTIHSVQSVCESLSQYFEKQCHKCIK